jgi:hypothetical protein
MSAPVRLSRAPDEAVGRDTDHSFAEPSRGDLEGGGYVPRKRLASHDWMSRIAALAIAVGKDVKPWGDSG